MNLRAPVLLAFSPLTCSRPSEGVSIMSYACKWLRPLRGSPELSAAAQQCRKSAYPGETPDRFAEDRETGGCQQLPGSAGILKHPCGFYLSVNSRILDVDSVHTTHNVCKQGLFALLLGTK